MCVLVVLLFAFVLFSLSLSFSHFAEIISLLLSNKKIKHKKNRPNSIYDEGLCGAEMSVLEPLPNK